MSAIGKNLGAATAVLSEDRRYRYFLQRPIGEAYDPSLGKRCTFVMLNPSTADETANDPTICRCMAFAKSLGCGRLYVVNLFAYRATDPMELSRLNRMEAIGPDNDLLIHSTALASDILICAWGNHGKLHGRGAEVLQMLRQIRSAPAPQALKLNKSGYPAHPLYLPANATPVALSFE